MTIKTILADDQPLVRSGFRLILEAEEDITIKTIDPSARGWFDVEDHPVLTAARRERLTAARTGFDMGIPFNELNRAFDLGFKPLPWGDHGYIPTAMQPAANAGVPPAGRAASRRPRRRDGAAPAVETTALR